MFGFRLVITIASAVLIFFPAIVFSDDDVKGNGIYKLRNRHDLTFLSAINVKTSNAPISMDVWRDAATQKWRAVKPYSSPIYQLVPTSDETRLMSMDSVKTDLVAQETIGYFFGLNTRQYWEIKAVGSGFSQLKNYKTEKCLSSFGNGKQVGVSACENSYRQQWEITSV